MKKLLAVYFSGTGNTAFAAERFCSRVAAAGVACCAVSIENFDCDSARCFDADTVLVAYPIYGSCMPAIMKDFVISNPELFQGKDLITLVTQHSFSGDGGALAARLAKGCGAQRASIHINMPSNISDAASFVKIKNGDLVAAKVAKAVAKIDRCAAIILNGGSVKNGVGLFAWTAGFFGQRLAVGHLFEKSLRSALKIDKNLCVRCGKCAGRCPMKNINIAPSGDISANSRCTLCYRCINLCPKKALSLISKKKPVEQYAGVGELAIS
jgi:NAD-dependent dihydropyrimidine dehydrogenase PreA subunit/flavodoxin